VARTDGDPNVDPYFTRKGTTVTKRNRTAIVARKKSKVWKTVDDKSEIGQVKRGTPFEGVWKESPPRPRRREDSAR